MSFNKKEYQRKYYLDNREHLKIVSARNKKLKPWIRAYGNANRRCNNPKDSSYQYYGAKGIRQLMTKDDFETLWFRDKAYLMKKPSIDRKDNDGNYTFENCRFIEEAENTARKNRENRKYSTPEIAREAYLKYQRNYDLTRRKGRGGR